MEKAELFEHNEKAYAKLINALKTSKCTTINHATGTGKSFIALKYLYEHRDKKFLYLAPTYPIIEQLYADCYKIGLTPDDINIDTMIYRTLLKMDMNELYKQYDGFIFDEYHRTGAKKTYQKIKQLVLNLRRNNDGKKFIGLTATPIRYLDNERNMTQEIFDNNVASSLSLSEAMLEGLLPVPLYINSKIACKGELARLTKKVSRLTPSKERNDFEQQLQQIDTEINDNSMNIQEMLNRYITEKNGKYIIFCNTIESLENIYENVDTWFSGFGEIKKYKVYSDQADEENRAKGLTQRKSKELNQANLDAFNNEKDGISVLLCIDILNEGVHVDDIDGVILLRRTISPIIYFQQIGRALSFSGRNKQIKIFDLVNNFGNHNAIDAIYTEIHEEMHRLILKHSEKKEQYEEILSRFRIMDETREILDKLHAINDEITQELIISLRINSAINLLKNGITNGEDGFFYILNNPYTQKAYETISKYYKYVTNEQFQQLLDLDILLPEELSMNYDERLELLKGCNSIKELEELEYTSCVDNYIQFIIENGRRPDPTATEFEEHKLGKLYLDLIFDFNNEQKNKLVEFMDSSKISYTPWEKALLGKKVDNNDIEDIINICNSYLEDNKILPEYLQRAIINITFSDNIEQNNELFSMLEKSEKIEREFRKQQTKERIQNLSPILNSLSETSIHHDKDLKSTGLLDKILDLNSADLNYIRKKYSQIKKTQYSQILDYADPDDITAFCKKIKIAKPEDISNYISLIDQEQAMYATLNGIIEFMVNNNGNLPNKESENELEKELANKLEEYIQNGILPSTITNLQYDMQSKWYTPAKIMNELILNRFKESDIKLTILKSLDFLNKNGHRPLKNSTDETEKGLAIDYETKCIKNLSSNEIAIINKIFLSKKNVQKTCLAYIQNIKAKQEGR